MIGLTELIALNECAASRQHVANPAKDARPCSFHFTNGGRAVILHSAAQRATLYLASDATITEWGRDGLITRKPNNESRNAFFAAQYWLNQGQAAVDAFIENYFNGTLENAESAACLASRPDWNFRRVRYQHGGGDISAFRERWEGAEERQSAKTWRWIHAKTRD